MLELFRVIANEWMKLLRRKRLWVAGILMLVTVALYGVTEYHSHQAALNNRPEKQLTIVEQNLSDIKAHPKSDPNYQQDVQSLQQQIATLKVEVAAEKPGSDWKTPLQQEKKADLAQMNQVPAGERASSPTWNYMQGQLMTINYQLQHNVRPLQPWQLSPYGEMMQYLAVAAMLFLPLVVAILVADMVAGEATEGTIKLLLVRPVSRAKILLGKWITSLFVSALATALTGAALWAVGVAILGNVGANQPIAVGSGVNMIHQVVAGPLVSGSTYNASTGMLVFQTYTHATVIPMWHYVLTGLALTVFAMLAVATVTFLCSTIFRSTMASTGVSLGLVIIGFVVAQMAIHVKWLVWLFFPVHLALFTNWAGQLSQEAQMNAPLGLGMLVLSVWGVLSLGVSLVYFSKRDILNA